MRALSLIACLTLAVPASAETPMSASEFEAYTEGTTLFYRAEGRDYGVEEYLPGRRVRWSFLDGECMDGEWYPLGELICFSYEGLDDDQCWSFYRRGDGLMARFENDLAGTVLFETRRSREPMMCPGPKVGV